MPTTSPEVSHIKISQASLISALTFIVGQLVAFVPSIASDQEILISAGTAVISAVFLVANGLHALASSNVTAKDVEAGAIAAAKTELSRVDFNGLVQDAVNAKGLPDVENQVRSEVQRLLSGLAAAAPAAPAPQAAAPSGVANL